MINQSIKPSMSEAPREEEEPQPQWLSNFVDVYQRLGIDNLYLINDIYHPQVTFKDPMHLIVGLDELSNYFDNLYTNLIACHFTINEVYHQGDRGFIYWQMPFVHTKLNGAQPITVEGHTKLIADQDKVIYHQDYLDAGAMLYENIPLLGRIIQYIKRRAKG